MNHPIAIQRFEGFLCLSEGFFQGFGANLFRGFSPNPIANPPARGRLAHAS